jgi:hypothetical protein
MLSPARAEVIGGTRLMAGSRIGLIFDPEQVIHHAAQNARIAFKPEGTTGVSKINRMLPANYNARSSPDERRFKPTTRAKQASKRPKSFRPS